MRFNLNLSLLLDYVKKTVIQRDIIHTGLIAKRSKYNIHK
jgi:hypothetical protein